MEHKEVAQRIADALGQGNLASAAHCATRLRLVLKDDSLIDQAALDEDPDLKGTFQAGGQYQIIVGPGDVDKVYQELVQITGAPAVTTDQAKEAASDADTNPVMAVVKGLSEIFVPLIPALCAGGLLLALNNVLTSEGLFSAQSLIQMYPQLTDLAEMISTFAAAAFAFLPVLLGFSATKRFGGNPYLGAIMGIIMVSPALINGYDVSNAMTNGTMEYWQIFGLNIAKAGYQGQVLPVIGVAWILANVEKFFHKRLNNAVDFTFTPLLTILITGFVTFAFVGPALRTVSDWLVNGLIWTIQTTGVFGYAIFGSFYSPIVVTGLHQSFPAIETALLADIGRTGGDFIFPIASVANCAQAAAALAIFFLTRNEKEKALASSSSISAFLGITEPAMFGVNLKNRYPFYCAMIASGVASVVLGLFKVTSASLGSAGLIGFISIIPKHIPSYLLAELVAIIVAFALTYTYGKRLMKKEAVAEAVVTTEVEVEAPTPKAEVDHEIISPTSDDEVTTLLTVKNPVQGQLIPLSDVNDPVFSTGMMGDGVAIQPAEGMIYSPVDGEVSVVYDESKHAYGLTADNGVEILLHIGIDTVQMQGQGFESIVKQGQKVKAGDQLGNFSISAIEKAGYDPTVMMIVTNTNNFQKVVANTYVDQKVGETALKIQA